VNIGPRPTPDIDLRFRVAVTGGRVVVKPTVWATANAVRVRVRQAAGQGHATSVPARPERSHRGAVYPAGKKHKTASLVVSEACGL
jgi:hypothetical protein